MQDLIDRLEKAAGPDRGLDAAIVVALNIRPDWCGQDGELWVDRSSMALPSPVIRLSRIGKRSAGDPPIGDYAYYTKSIDDALTLVPEGWAWFVEWIGAPFCEGRARLWIPSQRTQGLKTENVQQDAKTPALALCIAALKARMASQREG